MIPQGHRQSFFLGYFSKLFFYVFLHERDYFQKLFPNKMKVVCRRQLLKTRGAAGSSHHSEIQNHWEDSFRDSQPNQEFSFLWGICFTPHCSRFTVLKSLKTLTSDFSSVTELRWEHWDFCMKHNNPLIHVFHLKVLCFTLQFNYAVVRPN